MSLQVLYVLMLGIVLYAGAAELGDYCADEHQEGYLNEFHFVPEQSDDLLQQVATMHKKHRWKYLLNIKRHHLCTALTCRHLKSSTHYISQVDCRTF